MVGFCARPRYSPVDSTRDSRCHYPAVGILCYAATTAILVMTAFLLGQKQHEADVSLAVKLGITASERTLMYNRLYGGHPSVEADAAWEQIFPLHGGFFKHPAIAPQRAVFSVYHQLHCLNGIRHGYWALYDRVQSHTSFNESDLPEMAAPKHIRHCIDLLRQSMMCQPDLTIEYKDEAAGGVRGFGSKHICYDWGQLLDWTRNWEDFGFL